MYTPVYYIKVGFKGVKIIQACFRDVLSFGELSVRIFKGETVAMLGSIVYKSSHNIQTL